jgi:uncharacterized membrane protein
MTVALALISQVARLGSQAVIMGIAALVQWLVASSRTGGERREKTALDILKERYSRRNQPRGIRTNAP